MGLIKSITESVPEIVIDDRIGEALVPLKPEEYRHLEESILQEGCREPLVVWEKDGKNILIDGHNRYEICLKHNIPFKVVKKSFDGMDEAVEWVYKNQLGRRNLMMDQFKFLIGKLYLARKNRRGGDRLPVSWGKGRKTADSTAEETEKVSLSKQSKSNKRASGQFDHLLLDGTNFKSDSKMQITFSKPKTCESLGSEFGVSDRTVRRAAEAVEALESKAVPELQEAVREGRVKLSVAANLSELPKTEQTEIVARGEKEILEAAKRIKAEKASKIRQQRIRKIESITKNNTSLPMGRKYSLIYCDPPWRYEYSATESRKIENQYPTMTLEEICELPIGDIAVDDCVLFMWATSPKLKEALRVIDAWGFTYRTCAVWDKQIIGMGYYFRQQHELLLVATKGKMPPPEPANRVPSVYSEKRGKHSAKPEKFYEIIEKMYPELSKIELFGRSRREGWDIWGNQLE